MTSTLKKQTHKEGLCLVTNWFKVTDLHHEGKHLLSRILNEIEWYALRKVNTEISLKW